MEREKVFDPALARMACAIVLGSIMSILDTTIVNVALPTLGRQFHTTIASIQWVNTGYALSLAVVIPVTRWVMDRFGTRRAWLACIGMFLVGSAMSGAAWSLTTLIVCRVLQGLGGGMILPIGQTILSRAAGPARMGRVMTVVGVPAMIGPLLGPTLGGIILLKLTWHWIFYVNLPIGAVAVFLGMRFLQRDERRPNEPLDFLGLLLLPSGLACVIYGLSEIGNSGALTSSVKISVAVGVALIGGFVLHALRAAHPLLDIRLWKNRGFAIANTTLFIIGCGIQGVLLIFTLYFQLGRGFSPLKAGLLQSPASLTAMFFLPLSGIITDRIGARRIVPFGVAVSALSLFVWAHVGAATSLILLEFALVLRGVGLGTTSTPTSASGYAQLRASELGSASTVTNILQRLAGALGVAMMSVVLQRRIAATLPGHSLDLSSFPASGAAHALIAPALTHAFAQTFAVSALVCAAAIVPALFLRKRPSDPIAVPVRAAAIVEPDPAGE